MATGRLSLLSLVKLPMLARPHTRQVPPLKTTCVTQTGLNVERKFKKKKSQSWVARDKNYEWTRERRVNVQNTL